MSYELMFWRQEKMMTQTTELIAAALRRNAHVEGLSPLPVDVFLAKVMSSFPGAVKVAGGEREFIHWMSPNEEDSMKVTWSDQHVLVRCHHLPLNEVNVIVDIAKSFGCPLYDPQTKQRFRLVEK